jgi:hypothetical protein
MFGQLIGAIGTALAGRAPTVLDIEEAIVSDEALECIAKELLGRESRAKGADKCSSSEQWNALSTALLAGLTAEPTQAVAKAAEKLHAELTALAASKPTKWLAFIPLSAPQSLPQALSFELESLDVLCAILPKLEEPEHSKALEEAAHRFVVPVPSVGANRLPGPTFICACTGTPSGAAVEASNKFRAVRDAARVAGLLESKTPVFPSSSSTLSDSAPIHRVEVILASTAGGNVLIEPIWGSDFWLDAASIGGDAKWRKWYDRAVRVFAADSGPAAATLFLRLCRGLTVMARACSQANIDLRFLLSVIALEALVSTRKEDVTVSIRDIAARVMATIESERILISRSLGQAYDHRSRFVHDGQLPSQSLESSAYEQSQRLILSVWAELSRRLFDLAEREVSEQEYLAGLEELRGLTPFRHGVPWEQAFGAAARGAKGDTRE